MRLNLTIKNFKDTVLNSSKPVLVKFYTETCTSCQILNKLMEGLDNELKDMAIVGDVNINKEKELAHILNIKSVPTIVVFKNGKVINHHSGLLTKKEIIKLIP